MNERQLKRKIFIIRSLDMAFLLVVFSLGYYAVRYSENGAIMGAITLLGLFFVNKLGNYSTTKIAHWRNQLRKLEKSKRG